MRAEKPRREVLDSLTTGWNEVEMGKNFILLPVILKSVTCSI